MDFGINSVASPGNFINTVMDNFVEFESYVKEKNSESDDKDLSQTIRSTS